MVSRLRRVGRRGAYLIAQGSLFLGYGWGLFSAVSERPPQTRLLYTLVEHMAPLEWWGVLWMLTGSLALVAGASRHLRPLAFSGLMGLPTVWSLGLGLADLAPGVAGLNSWIAGLLFASLMASTAVVAGWPEDRR